MPEWKHLWRFVLSWLTMSADAGSMKPLDERLAWGLGIDPDG